MSSDPLELKKAARAEYHARWEAVETFKAQELAAMTDEQAATSRCVGTDGVALGVQLTGLQESDEALVGHLRVTRG